MFSFEMPVLLNQKNLSEVFIKSFSDKNLGSMGWHIKIYSFTEKNNISYPPQAVGLLESVVYQT